jgi:hypothetical protein
MAGALVAAAVVAFLGGKILAEYPFDSFLPILGAALLGLAVTGTAAAVLRAVPPTWTVVVTATMAVLVDTGPHGSIVWQGWAAMAVAGIGGLWRLRADLAERSSRPPE